MDPVTALQNIPEGPGGIVYLMGLAIVAVGFVCIHLYRKIDANEKKTSEKLQECEDDRLKLWEKVAVLEAGKAG